MTDSEQQTVKLEWIRGKRYITTRDRWGRVVEMVRPTDRLMKKKGLA